LAREQAKWEWMSFFVRRLQPGDVFQTSTPGEEAAFVMMGGRCIADWGKGKTPIGKRNDVFDGFPYTLYLPAGNHVEFVAESVCEIAECRVPSEARLEPKLIEPKDVASGLRGGGNVSRQIVDVIPPAFPADKLMVIEVYTPGGNWSSYPPHKHAQDERWRRGVGPWRIPSCGGRAGLRRLLFEFPCWIFEGAGRNGR
jgi:5-deoxy-glucuronate isomerase